MSKIDDDKVKELIHSMALKYNMSDEDMKNLVNSPYEFTKEKINNLKLKDITTKEELESTKTNFIYRSFFKLVVDWNTIQTKINRRQNINNINSSKWKK